MSTTAEQTMVIEVMVASGNLLLFQSLLEAEEGLGVVRCFDASGKKQQIWCAPGQYDDLCEWLNGLPASLQLHCSDKWILA